MKLIAHRRNRRQELEDTPTGYGVEVDIRSRGSELIMHHDALVDGESFDEWLEAYRHGTLILNVKEEGLEDALIARMRDRGLEDYFFLDQSFPFLVKTANAGESRCAVRVSEFESLDTALTLAGRIRWVWVDCFTRFPLDLAGWTRLKAAGFSLCLVSPELQGRRDRAEIAGVRKLLGSWGVEPDAVCTKLEMMSAWTDAD